MKSTRLLTALLVCVSPASGAEPPPAKAPAFIELRDQHDAPRRVSFPATNLVVLAIADRKGAEQVDGWIAALKPRYAGRVEIHGLADVSGVPAPWRGKVRRKFQETRAHPVMMDWSGELCAQLGFEPGVANVLVIGRDGTIRARFSGPAGDNNLKEAFAATDTALGPVAATCAKVAAKLAVSIQP